MAHGESPWQHQVAAIRSEAMTVHTFTPADSTAHLTEATTSRAPRRGRHPRLRGIGAALIVATMVMSVGGCSAIASLLPSSSAESTVDVDAVELASSCTVVTTALATVTTDLSKAQTGIAEASTKTALSKLSAADLAEFTKLASSAGTVATALTSVEGSVTSSKLLPEVTNLANSMAFFKNYFALLAKKSSDLPSVATAQSAAATAADAAASIASLCSSN